VIESFVGDEPGVVILEILNPWDYGYDKSLSGTDRWLYGICAKAQIGDIVVFATEVLVKGEDGINEVRCRFWIGYYRDESGAFQCVIPKGVRPPKELVHGLVMHNYREFMHLNKILPGLYAENKDNWFE